MTAPRIALHLREGIHPINPAGLPGVEVLPYPVIVPFAQLADQVRAANADIHLFADLLPEAIALQAMLRLLARHDHRAAATPATPTLERLGYAPPTPQSDQAVGVQIRPCHHLPAWCCAIPDALLGEFGFFDGDEATLDFRLLRLSENLRASDLPVASIGTPFRALDERAWARNLLLTLQAELAQDFARAAVPDHVPHQLRVTHIGTFAASPSPSTQSGPTLSLLCPAYKPNFIEEMIDSVLAQDYVNWELLLLVDGPPPDSLAAFESVFDKLRSEPRLKPAFQANAGTGVTRQRLFERASGEYVLFIDDDDALAHGCLSNMAAALAHDPTLDVVRGGTQLFGVVNRYLPPLPRLRVDGVSASLFEVNQPFAVRRALIESFGGLHGDPNFGGVGEDSDLFLRLDNADARTLLIDQPLYRRRLSNLNQSLSFGGGSFTEHVQTLVRRHAPPIWNLDALAFKPDAGFVLQTATYQSPTAPQVLHAPTRYFNYNTLGDDT